MYPPQQSLGLSCRTVAAARHNSMQQHWQQHWQLESWSLNGTVVYILFGCGGQSPIVSALVDFRPLECHPRNTFGQNCLCDQRDMGGTLARPLSFHFDPRSTRLRWIPTTNPVVNDSNYIPMPVLASSAAQRPSSSQSMGSALMRCSCCPLVALTFMPTCYDSVRLYDNAAGCCYCALRNVHSFQATSKQAVMHCGHGCSAHRPLMSSRPSRQTVCPGVFTAPRCLCIAANCHPPSLVC
jgi:hypothetical protein